MSWISFGQDDVGASVAVPVLQAVHRTLAWLTVRPVGCAMMTVAVLYATETVTTDPLEVFAVRSPAEQHLPVLDGQVLGVRLDRCLGLGRWCGDRVGYGGAGDPDLRRAIAGIVEPVLRDRARTTSTSFVHHSQPSGAL